MTRRAMTLLELLLALSVTAIVGMAIVGMMGAVTNGVQGRRDTRTVMVLANAAASRLSSYISPSCCILDVSGSNVTLWFNDSREGRTVHASEVRWLTFDADAGTLSVQFVKFPAEWSEAACDLEDHEYAANSNWAAVLASYRASGWIDSRVLVDSLTSATPAIDQASVLASRVVSYELDFQTEDGSVPVTMAATIMQHVTPVK